MIRLVRYFRKRVKKWRRMAGSAEIGAGDASTEKDFDLDLPPQHSYLGNLREISNTPYYAENDLILLPVVFVPDVVLMPNQQIPIYVDPDEIDLAPIINDWLDTEHQRKGFVCMALSNEVDDEILAQHPHYNFGTIASVIRMENTENEQGDDGIRMIVRGCQRCYRKKAIVRGGAIHQKHFGWFRILPNGMPNPLQMLTPNEWLSPFRVLGMNHTLSSYITGHNPFALSVLDTQRLVENVKHEMRSWQLDGDFPASVDDFSFWVSANLPVPADVRLHLLGSVSTTHRLWACLHMLRAFTQLDCLGCHANGDHTPLADKTNGLCMTREGLISTYINPTGHSQEIFTAKEVTNHVHAFGTPTLEYTWFPGYKWCHIRCRHCHSHLGWRYDAESIDMKPQRFYGLRRSDVLPSMIPRVEMSATEREEFVAEKMAEMTPVIYREPKDATDPK